MNRALARLSRRYLAAHPLQLALAVIGIGLGVAVAVAIAVASESARTAMRLSVEGIAGPVTHRLWGPPQGIDESLYVELRTRHGLSLAAPVLEGFLRRGERTVRVLGVDPLAELEIGRFGFAVGELDGGTSELMTTPGAVALTDATARALEVELGQRFAVEVAGRSRLLTARALFGGSALGAAAEDLLVMDIGAAQELFDQRGRLSWIDLTLEPAELESLGRLLPAGHKLEAVGARSETLESITRGFTLNLRALSLLALAVGALLIYNTLSFSVVQRRGQLGALRALGATRGQVFAMVMGESLGVAAIGTALGIGAGILLAQGLVHLVARTINDLYFVLSVTRLDLDPAVLAQGVALGLGVAVIAAMVPALEAANTRPQLALARSVIEQRSRRLLAWSSMLGLGLLAGGALLLLPEGFVWALAAVLLMMLGCAFLTPLAAAGILVPVERLLRRRFGLGASLAARGVSAALSRTSPAIAALSIAIAAAVGMGVMVESFRATVADWLDYHLQADAYVSVAGRYGTRQSAPLDPGLVARVAAMPGVQGLATWRGVEVDSQFGPSRLSVLGPGPRSRAGYRLLDPGGEAWERFLNGAVLVSESYGRRHGVGAGSDLVLVTASGPRTFAVAGVYFDYGSDRGYVLMERGQYLRHWPDSVISALGIYLEAGAELGPLLDRVHAGAGEDQRIVVRSNRDLREASLRIFDRTFTITRVLQLLAVAVAFVAVASALLAIQLERAREFAILRATGQTPAGLWALVLAQTGLMGLVAGLLALPSGGLLAVLLTDVVSVRSFGWTLHWQVPAGSVLGALGLAVGAALLAAVLPARRLARVPPALALRAE